MNALMLARELLHAWDNGVTAPSIAARDAAFDWHKAYEVSAALINLRRARGEKTVGRKIGFTNRNIWPQYGATSPIWHHVVGREAIRARVEQRNRRAGIELRSAFDRHCHHLVVE